MTHPYPRSARTSPTRNAQRVSFDRETVHAVLDEAVVCHVGFVVDGRPVVLPHLHARLGEVLYLHGSTGARAMYTARGDGLQVCVTATLLDGLVLARSAFHHSVNYRSVVVHGTASVVEDKPEKITALASLVEAACFLDNRGNKVGDGIGASYQSSGTGYISACPDPDGAGPEFSRLRDLNRDGRNDSCFQSSYQDKGFAGDDEYHARVNNTGMAGQQQVKWGMDRDGDGRIASRDDDDIKVDWSQDGKGGERERSYSW